jgi:hypothetical protein
MPQMSSSTVGAHYQLFSWAGASGFKFEPIEFEGRCEKLEGLKVGNIELNRSNEGVGRKRQCTEEM